MGLVIVEVIIIAHDHAVTFLIHLDLSDLTLVGKIKFLCYVNEDIRLAIQE